MNTYLLPYYDPNTGVETKVVRANNRKDAIDKYISFFYDEYEDIDYPCDWRDLIRELDDINIILGDLYDIDEF